MVIRLVARINTVDMKPMVLYPLGAVDEERIALLMGIIQLVTAALQTHNLSKLDESIPHFMKSSHGVIGYCTVDADLFICEGDEENATGEALKAATSSSTESIFEIARRIEKTTRKRAREIGNLWK